MKQTWWIIYPHENQATAMSTENLKQLYLHVVYL